MSYRMMRVPSIHLNGSHKDTLLEQVTEAASAVMEALRKLETAWPNGRDYYPQGPDALREAEAEWRSRSERLSSVYDEMCELAEAIADIGDIGNVVARVPMAS